MKPLIHQSLQPGFVEDVVSEFFVGEHGQRGTFSARNQLRSFFDREVRVLADDGHDHADHQLQAANLVTFLLCFAGVRVVQKAPTMLVPRRMRAPAA